MDTRVRWRDPTGLVALLAVSSMMLLSSPAAAQAIPLAIKGYDPVAYFDEGRPTRGLPEFEYDWGGLRYRFSRAEHRELFSADPAHYAPQFGNFCAMALSKGELSEADPENWLISEGKLYIFGKPVGPDLFRKDLAGNVTKANRNRALLSPH